MRNKKVSGAVRPFPLPQTVLGKAVTNTGGVPAGPEVAEKRASPTEGSGPPQLIPRGGETLDKMGRALRNGSNGVTAPGHPATGPNEQ